MRWSLEDERTRKLVGMGSMALVAIGLVVMAASLFAGGGSPRATSCSAGSACAVRSDLRAGLAAARSYYSRQNPPSYAGFTSAAGRATDPSLPWAPSSSPQASRIAVTNTTSTSAVLVGLTSSGQAYCVADKHKQGTVAYGKTAAVSAAQCSGGW